MPATIVRVIAITGVLATSCFYELKEKAAVTDPDVWWHLRVGDWIRQFSSMPRTGLFSAAQANPWMAYSWVFEVILSFFHSWFGLGGLVIMLMLFELTIASGLFYVMYRFSGRVWMSAIAVGAAMWAMYHAITIRPMLFSLVFFIAVISILYHVRQTGRLRPLIALLPIFAVWANSHIQFIYGLFAVGVFAGEILVQRLASHLKIKLAFVENLVPAREAFLCVGGCLAATLLNPYSYHLYQVVAQYASSTSFYNQIQDLMAMNFRSTGHYVELMVCLAGFYFLGRARRWDIFSTVMLVTMSLSAFRSTRDAWQMCVVVLLSSADSWRTEKDRPQPQWWLAPVAAALAAMFLVGSSVAMKVNNQTLTSVVQGVFPVDAADFIRSNRISGPIYTNIAWGGFLDWYLPENSASIDGRGDLYGEQRFNLNIGVVNTTIPPLVDPDLQNANMVVVSKAFNLSRALASGPFRLAYEDTHAVVYLRAE